MVGRFILIAPQGSAIPKDETGIRLPDGSIVRLGEQLSGGGGYVDYETAADVPRRLSRCAVRQGPSMFAVLNPTS